MSCHFLRPPDGTHTLKKGARRPRSSSNVVCHCWYVHIGLPELLMGSNVLNNLEVLYLGVVEVVAGLAAAGLGLGVYLFPFPCHLLCLLSHGFRFLFLYQEEVGWKQH